ncbi:MAG: hypothetical protein WA004_11065 [Saprospiraceae bacterium]
MKKILSKPSLFIAALAAAVLLAACQKTDDEPGNETANVTEVTSRANADSKVFPPAAHPYGKSYPEWTQVWLEQFNTYDCATVPWANPESVLFYTSGPVYMLAGIAEVGGSANITVPHGKALMFPLVNIWLNYPCPWTWEPPAGVPIGEWLTDEVETALTFIDVSSLSVTIDGNNVSNMGSYKFVSDPFDCTVNPDLANCVDPCATGEPQPTVMGGYYVMLKPLSKGQHTVHYHMYIPEWNALQDATYNITVE